MTVSLANRLRAEDVSVRFGAIVAVDRMSLALNPGEVLGLIGPNGAGKTTFIDALSGFRTKASGRVWIGSAEVTRLSPDRRARMGLARTFQESPTIPGLDVRDHVRLAEDATRRDDREDYRTDAVLERLGLLEHAATRASELPLAQRRMLDLARALATAPSVLLLDEPFAGLGEAEVQILDAEVRRLSEHGSVAVVVEHRLALLRRIVDRTLVMVQGAELACGSFREVLEDPAVQRAYLGRSAEGGDR